MDGISGGNGRYEQKETKGTKGRQGVDMRGQRRRVILAALFFAVILRVRLGAGALFQREVEPTKLDTCTLYRFR